MSRIRQEIDNDTLRIRCEALMGELQAAYAFGNKLLQENAALKAELARACVTSA